MSAKAFITPFNGYAPIIDPDAYVDPSARLIGRIRLAAGVSVWPGAVLRADDAEIVVEQGSGILDLCLLESPGGSPVVVEAGALISHQVCLHGATVKSGALVGIGAIVLDKAVIGEGAIVGAGSVVPPGMQVPPGKLLLGAPARPVRDLKPQERGMVRAQLAELREKSLQYRALLGGI